MRTYILLSASLLLLSQTIAKADNLDPAIVNRVGVASLAMAEAFAEVLLTKDSCDYGTSAAEILETLARPYALLGQDAAGPVATPGQRAFLQKVVKSPFIQQAMSNHLGYRFFINQIRLNGGKITPEKLKPLFVGTQVFSQGNVPFLRISFQSEAAVAVEIMDRKTNRTVTIPGSWNLVMVPRSDFPLPAPTIIIEAAGIKQSFAIEAAGAVGSDIQLSKVGGNPGRDGRGDAMRGEILACGL